MMDLVSSFLDFVNHIAPAVRNYFFAFVGSTQDLCPLSIRSSALMRDAWSNRGFLLQSISVVQNVPYFGTMKELG